jgi:outer membrane protein insertion porin family
LSFPEIKTEQATDVQGLTVTVTVDEGQSYTLGKVTIDGQPPVDAKTLMKAGDFKTGDVANIDLVNEGVERIRKAVKRAGYIESTVGTTRRIDEGKKTVNIAVHIDAGPQFTMGKLNLVGLDLEGEAEIKRMWGLKLGSAFDAQYPDLFLARVKEMGVFDHLGKTRAETKPNAHEHSVDVTLYFGADPGGTKPGRRGGVN